MDKNKNLVIAVSGGRSSARMAHHIENSPLYDEFNKLYVFCNTGMERPETINFLKDIRKFWGLDLYCIEGVYSLIKGVGVSYKIVDWDSLNMDAKPFSEAIAHKSKGAFSGVPFQNAPYCSDMLKVQPNKKFADDIFGVNNYIKAIGFRKEDMPKRITYPEIESDKNRIFPLLTDFYNEQGFRTPLGQNDLNIFFDKQPFKLEISGDLGNCELCWKKSKKTLIENIRHGTRFIDWYKNEEEIYGNTSFRGHLSIEDLVKLAEQPRQIKLDFPDDEGEGCSCGVF